MNTEATLHEMKNSMDLLIHNPALMQRRVLRLFSEAMGGQNAAVDPTSPFMQLIEASVTSASAAVDHQLVNLAKRYAVLATTEEDLYHHMSNDDYRTRFTIAATGEFTLIMPVDTLMASAIPSINGVYRYVSIPLDTQIEVDGVIYSINNAIEIRIHRNKVIKVIQLPNLGYSTIETNIIESHTLRDNANIPLLTFNIDTIQLRKKVYIRPIQTSTTFREHFEFTEGYHSLAIYYLDTSQNWQVMDYSHSDQSFDVNVPKAIIKIHKQTVYVYIPPIYGLNGLLGGEIRVVLYTSVGAIDIDYADIKKEFFETHIDSVSSDLTAGDVAFTNCSYIIYSTAHIVGGRDPLSFDEMKKRTLDNNIGINHLPITPASVIANAEDYGFDAVQHMDTLTGRVYTMSSPIPIDPSLNIKTEPDVGFIQLMESIDSLATYDTILNNENSVTILPTTLYELDQLNVRIVNKDVIDAYGTMEATQLINSFNNTVYRYSPFFYVLTQNRDILEGEIYQLDTPKVEFISFMDQNASVDYYLTQTGIDVRYKEGYYEVVTFIKQDHSLSSVSASELYGQISYIAENTNQRMYVVHDSIVAHNDGFVVTFKLMNNLHIIDDNLVITNSVSIEGIGTNQLIGLSADLYITYGTTVFPTSYIRSAMDDITYSKDYARRYPLTLERVNVTFGINLTYLWRDIRPVGTKIEYLRAETDIPMVYLDDVLNGDPDFVVNADCTITVDKLHEAGDTVVTTDGEIVYQYRKGDLLLDDTGNPIVKDFTAYSYYIDMFVLDGAYYITNDKPMLKHMQWVSDYIVKQSTIGIKPLQSIKLEHTDLLYKPRDSLGYGEVYTSKYDSVWINKRAFLNVIIYVEETIYNNMAARKIIEHTTFEVINNNLRKQVISHDVITGELREAYQLGVISVTLEPTEGAGRIPSFSLKDTCDRISLRKVAYLTPAGVLSVKEDIAILFVDYTVK